MASLFDALSLPCELSLTVEAIDEAWRNKSREHHPDVCGEEGVEISAQLNEAREVLSRPAGILGEWLKVKRPDSDQVNTALSESLMTLFTDVEQVLREADKTLSDLKTAQTALARSLLAPKAIAVQRSIQSQLSVIAGMIEEVNSRFREIETSAKGSCLSEVSFSLR